ncbi:hypothetical protein MMAR_1424 [Mycobacterium marinum M]|uniref:Uncharacterized protein n=1 Tax=Mycobacterium marinum (strain ATCC BAA-535 / M) TaxID=216594 RepID=B2HFN7_MYCMM|nr:hypothetical protein MMAR_1424 [Mycobacterium marinum M]
MTSSPKSTTTAAPQHHSEISIWTAAADSLAKVACGGLAVQTADP